MSELLRDEELPTIPENEEQIQRMFPQCIMFSTVKPGVREYLCSRCGGKWKHTLHELKQVITPEDRFWDGVKVNDRVECPKCGCVSLVKNRKTFKTPWKGAGIVYLFPISEDYVVARCVFYAKYGDDGIGEENVVRRYETNRYHFRNGVKTVFFAASSLTYDLRETKHITEPFSWWNGMYTERYGYSAVTVKNNGMEIKDTFLKYFPDEQLVQEYQYERHHPLMKLLSAYAYHPRQVETLAKVGQFEAIRALAEGAENSRVMDWNALTPWAMHRLPKQVYEVWKKNCCSSLDTLKLYRFIGQEGVNGMRLARQIETEVNEMTYNAKLTDGKRAVANGRLLDGEPDGFVRYINKLTEKYNSNTCAWTHVFTREVYETYCDYIETAKKLGCLDKVPLFPHDLKERHDRLVAEWRRQEDERREAENARFAKERKAEKARQKEEERKRREETERTHKGVRERYAEIREKYEYSDGVYSIVVPGGASDIVEEGLKLLHCTGSSDRYFSRIVSGESYIFFLRKAEKPDEPWYTLEVEPGGTIRQKRTKYDRQEADLNDAIPFLREWQKRIAPRMTEEDLRAAVEAKRLRIAEFEELRRNDTRIRNGQLKGQRLADVLTDDLMEAILDQRSEGFEEVQEVKKA